MYCTELFQPALFVVFRQAAKASSIETWLEKGVMELQDAI